MGRVGWILTVLIKNTQDSVKHIEELPMIFHEEDLGSFTQEDKVLKLCFRKTYLWRYFSRIPLNLYETLGSIYSTKNIVSRCIWRGKASLEIIVFFIVSILDSERRDLIIPIDKQGGEGSPQVKQQIKGRNEAGLQITLPSLSRLIL